MAGKKGRSGRPPGTLSCHMHPTARCGMQLNALIEMWLALTPGRRHTVPPRRKRAMAECAIREVLFNEIELEQAPEVLTKDVGKVLRLIQDDDPEIRQIPGVVVIDVDDVLAWSRRRAPDGPSLRRKVRGPDAYDQYVARISNAWRLPQRDMHPGPGDDSAVNLTVSLRSVNPHVCWTVTDERIVASAVTTFTIPEADCHLVSTTLTIPN
jgi:hypothetical protein